MSRHSERPPQRGLRGLLYKTVNSIKTQMAVAMLFATLTPLAIVTVLNSRAIGKETLAMGRQALRGAAQQTAQSLDAFVEMGLYHGAASAALPELHRYFQDPKNTPQGTLQKTLVSIQNQNPVFIRHVSLFDLHGVLLTSSSPQGMDREHRLFPETLHTVIETGSSTVSPIHFEDGIAYLCFYSPIIEDEEPIGLLRISYSASILQQLISQYTGLLDASSYPILINENGLQIANGVLPHGNPEKLYIFRGKIPPQNELTALLDAHRLPPDFQQPDKLPSLSDHSTTSHMIGLPLSSHESHTISESVAMESKPWHVEFFESEEAFLLPVHLQNKNTLFLGGALALFAVLLALWLAKKLTAPLQSLTKTAQQATQEMRPLPLTIQSKNEIGTLAKSFNQLFKVLSNKQQELTKSEENLRVTLNSIGDCVITTDTEGLIVGANPAAEALLGKALRDFKGRPLSEVLPLIDEKTRQPLADIAKENLASGITLNLPEKAIFITAENEEKRVADSAAVIRDAAGKIIGCVMVLRDVTEKYQLESRLAQSQKMDALGQMAGGMAHDFNNMLTPILGAAQLLEEENINDEDRKKYSAMISTAGKRAAALTQHMLTFSRKAPASIEPIDLRELIEDSRSMLQHAIGSHISIRTYRPIHPMITMGDPSQIQNIFFNLALNARDAMPKHGTLAFQIKRTFLDQEYCRLHSHEIEPGAYIEVQISDTGEGIAPNDLPNIFDPFFTTKPAGKGTGLGLATVYGVMKKHKGMVSVYSEKGHGTVFHLYFPECKNTSTIQEDLPLPAPEGTPKILLIDDEESVQVITTALLKNLGYEVLCAKGGAEGIELYQTHWEQISLIMLDLVMPKMNGEETFSKLREIQPEAKILIISGFDAEESISKLLKAGAAGFIQKPFQKGPLAKAIQRALVK